MPPDWTPRPWRLLAYIVAIELLLEVGLYEGVGPWLFGQAWVRDRTLDPLIHVVWLLCVATPVLWAVLVRDARQTAALHHAVWRQAHEDDLTGLANRRRFLGVLRGALAARPAECLVAVLLVDLDRFKAMNDAYGHEVGDHVLQAVAQRLRETCGPGTTVARLGGDEFAVIIPSAQRPEDATQRAEALLGRFREPVAWAGRTLSLSASVGIAVCPTSGMSAADLLKSADTAMYEAKRLGRDRWVLHLPALQAHAYAQYQLEQDLRQALTLETELTVEYQPQVDVATGVIRGSEALLRWHHPRLGSISPGEFIPLAEEAGLAPAIGTYVRGAVYRQWQAWQTAGFHPLPVAINVSPHELAIPDFATTLLEDLAQARVSAPAISVEITEVALLRDLEVVRDHVTRLRAAGIRVLIDDFGTGYNSLAVLRELPVDGLKLDGAFVQQMHTNAHDQAAVTALVTMGHAYGLDIIAERVEQPAQLALLQAVHCDLYQGYLPGAVFAARYLARAQAGASAPVGRP